MAVLASPPRLLPAFPASARLLCLHRKVYFAQSHKPPFHGRVCAAPPGCLLSSSPDGPTKGFFYVPSEKGTCTGRLPWGLGRPGPTLLYRRDSLCSAQGPPLGHLRLQPLREHRLREASRAAAGGHGSHGLRGLWHYWHQPHAAGGQPCHRRPGTWAHFEQMPEDPTAPGSQTRLGRPLALLPTPPPGSFAHRAQTGPPWALEGTVSLEE